MRTVGKKFITNGALGTQSANRSPEMRPKTRTVWQKRDLGVTGISWPHDLAKHQGLLVSSL